VSKSIFKDTQHSNPLLLNTNWYFENIKYSYRLGNKKINAINDISFELKKGEILFLTGPSGAGKTTLLKMLSGELLPDSGKIDPGPIRDFYPKCSLIYQDLKLLEHYTILENLEIVFNKKTHGSKSDFLDNLHYIAKVLDVYNRLNLKIKDCNGGLKQKVAFMRAILTEPDILIADEPTCSLDFENAHKIFEIIELYNQKMGMTVVWASHNRDLVRRFSGRLLHIEKGQIMFSGHACFM